MNIIIMRRIILTVVLASFLGSSVLATDPKESFEEYAARKKEEFNTYRQQKKTEFEQYRQRLNEEFAARLSGEWKQYKPEPKRERAANPKPPKPSVVDKTKPTAPVKVPVKSVVPPEKKIADVPVTLPKIDRRKPAQDYPVRFSFYNTPCGIGEFDKSTIHLCRQCSDLEGLETSHRQRQSRATAHRMPASA